MIRADIYEYGVPLIDGPPKLIETRTDFQNAKELTDHLVNRQRKDYCNPDDIIHIKKTKNAKDLDVIEVYNEESDFNYFALYKEI
jgi:hypothetical protein